MSKIERPKLAYVANRINGGYTPAMDRAISPSNLQELEKMGYKNEEANRILKATAAAHRLMRRHIETRDLLDLFEMGFESIMIKAESAYRHELERQNLNYVFDASTNIFTVKPS